MKGISKAIRGIIIILLISISFGIVCPAIGVTGNSAERTSIEISQSNYFNFIPNAYAEGETKEETKGTELDPETIKAYLRKLSIINKIVYPVINYMTRTMGNFLKTDYIYEGEMGKMLKNIWITSRNIVNIVFVFLLLYIAIQQIFSVGGGEE